MEACLSTRSRQRRTQASGRRAGRLDIPVIAQSTPYRPRKDIFSAQDFRSRPGLTAGTRIGGGKPAPAGTVSQGRRQFCAEALARGRHGGPEVPFVCRGQAQRPSRPQEQAGRGRPRRREGSHAASARWRPAAMAKHLRIFGMGGNSLKRAVARAQKFPAGKQNDRVALSNGIPRTFESPEIDGDEPAGRFNCGLPKSDRAAVPSGKSRAAVKRTKLNFLRGEPSLRPPIPNCQETRPCPLDTACLLFRPARAKSYRLRAR